ncbi:hypothetical protein BROUX41_004381 [Berkeleyomyces rouxiae]|uniref:uncharacterized protein n=1 Tax=Berkeleyomyces rouxiae TaxID=2035830 RepID=UPI003B7DF8B6
MFQRIKGAIDRTIAEEQARMKALSDQTATASPSLGSTRPSASNQIAKKASAAQRARKKPAEDFGGSDISANPDPSVFEEAFFIDNDSEQSDKNTSPPSSSTATMDPQSNSHDSGTEKLSKNTPETTLLGSRTSDEPTPAAGSAELSVEIRSKLRKLEKIEGAYSELLRSYRIAHGRATSIEPFEQVLKENTPLTSIRDTEAFAEYLNQANLKSHMLMEELKRITTEKDGLQKENAAQADQIKTLKLELATTKENDREKTSSEKGADAGAETRNESPEEFFSFDSEVKEGNSSEADLLRNKISTLEAEVETVKKAALTATQDLQTAKEAHSTSLQELTEKAKSLTLELKAKEEKLSLVNSQLSKTEARLKTVESDALAAKKSSASEIKGLKTDLNASSAESEGLQTKLASAVAASGTLENTITDLKCNIDELKLAKKVDEARIAELTVKLAGLTTETEIVVEPAPADKPQNIPSNPPNQPTTGGSKKKNNKKKKKGGAANLTPVAVSAGSTAVSPSPSRPVSPAPVPTPTAAIQSLNAEITRLEAEVASKEHQVQRLTKQHKDTETLREEIETLRYELLEIGQEHVVSKAKIKDLSQERDALQARIKELEEEVSSDGTAQKELDKLQEDYNELKSSTEALKSDLAISESLAQTRFRELTELREVLQRAQPELKSLRQDSEALKNVKTELGAKMVQISELEKREKDARSELSRTQRINADREADIKALRERLASEEKTRLRFEDSQRVAGRDLRRAQAEKIEIAAREEKATRELEKVREELQKLRLTVQDLEDQVEKLKREGASYKGDADLKAQQYANVQSLVSSMRDEASELRVQLREAQSQAESVGEELVEVQRLLSERTREAETMRRLLADVDERADNKVREIRARLEAAQEERDRMEDESSALARRKTREGEELKQRIRDLERDLKRLTTQNEELEGLKDEWRLRREELESAESGAVKELKEVQTAVAELRAALDASEKQLRHSEAKREETRQLLDETKQRFDRTMRDLKAAQLRLGSSPSRTSIDSAPANTPANTGGAADAMYIKTIMLQFLEQKDAKLRSQLVPVLGRLLQFNE